MHALSIPFNPAQPSPAASFTLPAVAILLMPNAHHILLKSFRISLAATSTLKQASVTISCQGLPSRTSLPLLAYVAWEL